MADNFKQNNKDAKEYYETQQRIAEVIKRQTESWSTFGEAQKEVSKNAKAIRGLNEEIAKLANATTKEEKAKAEELRKQKKYLVELNKELLKTSTLAKAAGKSIKDWGLRQLDTGLTSILDKFDAIDGSARRSAIQIGMSVTRMNQFKNIAGQSASQLALLGIHGEKAGEMMSSMNEETGRQVMLTQQTIVLMGNLAKRTGMAETEMSGLVGQMEAFGMGTQVSAEMIQGIADMSDKMGVNTSKVVKKVQQNLSLLNKLSFKGGVKGMAQMAAYSEKYKLSMAEVAGFADKVFRPEGAIDAAANLQVLGGSLAQMGDPFQLMYQARNAPEEFAKNITKAAAASAEFDKKTGEFKVSAYELDRLREASEATGISMEELVATAKQSAKINMFEGALKVGGEDKEFLSSIADMDEKGAFVVNLKGDKQYLDKMSQTEQQALANDLSAQKEASDQRALEMQTTMERLKNMMESAFLTLIPYIQKLDDTFRGPLLKAAKWMYDTLIANPWIPKLILALMVMRKVWTLLEPILGPIAWMLNGRALARGFNAGVAKGPLGAAGGAGGAAGGAGGPEMVKSKSGKMYDANSPQGKMIRTKGGTTPLSGQSGATAGANPSQTGDSAGKSAGNMLKGAAAILILSAALFVFAKALQEFDKLQNGWQTLATAAVSLIILSGALFLVGKIMDKAAGSVIKGSVAIAILGAALIPFGYAMQMLQDVGVGTMLGAALALGAFALVAGIMGAAIVPMLLGAVAIAALSGALMLFGLALQMMAPGFEMFISAFGLLPTLIGPMLAFGPALMLMALGFGALAMSLMMFGASMFLALPGLAMLAATSLIVKDTFSQVDPSAVASAVVAINSVDMAKVEAIRDMANSLSLVSLFGGLKIEFGDIDVKGSIKVNEKDTNWVSDPIFVSKLKDVVWEAMEKGKSGGKP